MNKINKYLLLVFVILLFACENNYYDTTYKNSENGVNNVQPSTNTLVDIDGNVYNAITINNQTWMAENLKVTHYADGTDIPYVGNTIDWKNLQPNNSSQAAAWCVHGITGIKDDAIESNNYQTYGALYTYAAAMGAKIGTTVIPSSSNPSGVQGVCPDGWHLPSDYEWMKLEESIGMYFYDSHSEGWRGINEGSKLTGSKELWNDGALTSNDSLGTSDFNSKPAGYRNNATGLYDYLHEYTFFCTSTSKTDEYIYYRRLYYQRSQIYRYYDSKDYGFSVRCVKD